MKNTRVLKGHNVPILPYGPYFLAERIGEKEEDEPHQILVIALDTVAQLGIKVGEKLYMSKDFPYRAMFSVDSHAYYLVSIEDVLGWVVDNPGK